MPDNDVYYKWHTLPDSERQGATLYTMVIPELGVLTVQEVAANDWGWTLSRASDGFPIDFRYGYNDPEDAKRAGYDHCIAADGRAAD